MEGPAHLEQNLLESLDLHGEVGGGQQVLQVQELRQGLDDVPCQVHVVRHDGQL